MTKIVWQASAKPDYTCRICKKHVHSAVTIGDKTYCYDHLPKAFQIASNTNAAYDHIIQLEKKLREYKKQPVTSLPAETPRIQIEW
jgi:Asp-tRNA(Asn)/Glu-tRNA(Gln) amidotransferase B subunit